MFPMTKEDYDKNEFALNATWTSFTSKKKKKEKPKNHKYKSQLYQFCKTHFSLMCSIYLNIMMSFLGSLLFFCDLGHTESPISHT